MVIEFDRDSCGMADDIDSHKKTFIVSTWTTIEEIMPMLEQFSFFPNISGGNKVLWILYNADNEKILTYNASNRQTEFHTDKIYIKDICNWTDKLHFKHRLL